MEVHEFLKSKEQENKLQNFAKTIQALFFDDKKQLNQLKNLPDLNQEQLKMGMLLLNRPLDKEDKKHYYIASELSARSDRFYQIQEMCTPDNFWEKQEPLILYFFGDKTPYIKSAWASFPQLMYQKGWDRRSFRAPNLTETYFLNQLNFIIELFGILTRYDLSLSEYALYSNHIYSINELSYLLASAINEDKEGIKPLLLDIVYGRHETGTVSREIIKGMLLSEQEECWEAIGKLLLSAQRQEGLRQTIVETLDETNLGAMIYMLRLIQENNLSRFSAVVRALDTWAGLGWEGEKQATVKRFLELALYYLETPENIQKGILSKDNAEVYMALWAQGVFDIEKCMPLFDQILTKATQEKTVLVLLFLQKINIPHIEVKYGLKLLESNYLLAFLLAAQCLNENSEYLGGELLELFDYLETRLNEVPEKSKTKTGVVFSWTSFEVDRNRIYSLMMKLVNYDKEEEIAKMLPHFSKMAVYNRENFTSSFFSGFHYWERDKNRANKTLTQQQRDFAFLILKDRGESIKSTAISALKYAQFEDHEMQKAEEMLKRKSAEVRKQVIALLLKQNKNLVKTSTQRLLNARNQEQRLAGLDILVQTNKKGKDEQSWVKNQAQEFAERPKISKKEQIILNTLITKDSAVLEYNAENGYGLFDPTKISAIKLPTLPTEGEYVEKTKVNSFGLSKTPEEINKALQDLHDLYIANQNYEYTYESWDDTNVTVLLGNRFAPIKRDLGENSTPEEKFVNYPLAEIWRKWLKNSQLTASDLFLIRLGFKDEDDWNLKGKKRKKIFKHFEDIIFLPKIPAIGNHNPTAKIVDILRYIKPYEEAFDFFTGLIQTLFYRINTQKIQGHWNFVLDNSSWRSLISYNDYASQSPQMNDEEFKQFWYLDKWWHTARHSMGYENYVGLSSLYNYTRAYSLQLIEKDEMSFRVMKADAIRDLSRPIPNESEEGYEIRKEFPFLVEMLETCRNRILEIELKRGDSETSVTHLARSLNEIYGIKNYVNILVALDKENLNRGYSWGNTDKKTVLSELLQSCKPTPEDTQETFNTEVQKAQLKEKRLIESAMYATQWIPFVAKYLDWKHLASAIWWLHAHTNSYHTAETESEISKYSVVPISDFRDGAVDTDWFQAIYKLLGAKKWKLLYDSAKYVSDGTGHRRAMLYADVILGKTKITEIKKKINQKRNQDYVRVYGLVPLQRRYPQKDLLRRYQLLQKFKKESKQFGAQRQASEGRAVRIAMENLARTAGYSDPIRLTWAMESKEAQEILAKASKLTFDEVSIELKIDDYGKSFIAASRKDKALKSIPAKYRKDKAVQKLKEFHKTLSEQYKRTRKSLETAMVNGDEFTQDEIRTLAQHPVVSPMLKNLVLYSDKNIGFYQEGELRTPLGKTHSLGAKVRIAHCTNLYQSGEWSSYQGYCFENQIKQVFKQIFRELYIPTEDELKEKSISRRYAGHQVQPNKTVALLKAQGWTVDYEEGLQKTFHKEGYIAKMYAMADWFSPADVESPTLETVQFIDRDNWKKVAFEKVEPRIFSEVMRDIDLVVSVAHVGDVDPEASQSSIELRAVILTETMRLFKIDNVKVEKNHALIEGKKNNYSVHLGSAIAHKVPGVYLSILPVHSQHRGRLFLPFLDEDPKTAELISKVLLLAKDDKIQDPTVLRQLS